MANNNQTEVEMQQFYCPVCGTAHTEEKEIPFRIEVTCPKCETTLDVEKTEKALTVRFQEPKEGWQ